MRAYSAEQARNIAFATEMYRTVLMPFDPARLEQYFSPHYIQHSALAADGLPALRAFLDDARKKYPHATTDIKRVFADADHVIFHVHVVLTPGDPGLAVIDIFRLHHGLIAEHWDVVQPISPVLPNANGMF